MQWNYFSDEVYTATVRRLVELRLVIWRLSENEKTSATDVTFAKHQFATQSTGIRLLSTIHDVRKAGITKADCLDVATLKTTPNPNHPTRTLFEPGAVNIYYVDECGPDCADGGRSCAGDPDVGFVYPIGSNNTLLHELGHALLGAEGTRHWKLSVSDDNLMRDGTATKPRSTISIGQAIAMNYEKTSVLGLLKHQAQALECRVDCPPLEFDQVMVELSGAAANPDRADGSGGPVAGLPRMRSGGARPGGQRAVDAGRCTAASAPRCSRTR